MGYTTDFTGSFKLKFNDESKKDFVIEFVNGLSTSRRMKRDMRKIADKLEHPVEHYGVEGEFYIEKNEPYSYDRNCPSLLDINTPPSSQPGLWLKWHIEDGELKWNGNEKFYSYIEWLEYLLDKIFVPNGVVLDGSVEWYGEDRGDVGTINMEDNKISIT